MGKSKKHRSPSPEWKNLEAQCLWPEQIAYEIIRPCQLEKQSITQRAVEVGLHPRTIARKLERFQQLGLPGLVPDSPDDNASAHRCAESLGRSGMLSVGSQSDVRRRPFGGDR